jgi:hypothetical protein
MIAGYLHITLELLSRFSKKGFGKLIYLFKEGFSQTAFSKAVALPGEQKIIPTGILPQSAQAAFRAFAESIASSYCAEDYVQVLLIHAGQSQTDAEIAEWLFPYIDSEAVREQKKNTRTAAQWIKYGAKPSAGFSLFRRH